jgi:1-aminocyclopropane-1-carboxylate deaminase/D-cysteine desulfhydrase-like pyridoxal-dependent ACC family enzyme
MTFSALEQPYSRPVDATPGSPLSRLLAFERLGLGDLPTPVEERKFPDGSSFLIKRDDLVGFGRGGIKARKIDFLVKHLTRQGHRSLVTVATNVTNLVHDIVPVLKSLDIDYRVFVSNDPPLPPALRSELFAELAGDRLTLVGRSRVDMILRVGGAAALFHARGQRPLVLLPSLGHAASVIGVARGFVEAIEQIVASTGSPPKSVFITAASGVSLAGIALGERILRAAGGPRIHIIGVSVYSGPIRDYAWLLVRWAERQLGIPALVDLGEVRLTPWRDVGDFGEYQPVTAELCRRVERDYGLRIDPIYGGKTWGVMESMVAVEKQLMPCLYWHCGFTPDWARLRTDHVDDS